MYIYSWKTIDIENGEENIDTGITCAEDYGEAMNKVLEFTGDNHDEFCLSLIAEDTLSMDIHTITCIKNNMVW